MVVPEGSAHAVGPGYASIDTNQAVSGPTRAWYLLATTSNTVPGEHQSWRKIVFQRVANILQYRAI